MSQDTCNGGALVGSTWKHCVLAKAHTGKCLLMTARYPEPLTAPEANRLGAVELKTRTTTETIR